MKVGLYLFAFAAGSYFLWVGCLLLLLLLEGIKELPWALSNFFTSRDKIRTALGWIIAISVSIALMLGLSDLLNAFGVVTYIAFDEPILVSHRYYDEEIYGDMIGLGTAILILSLMLGARSGMAIYEGNLSGGLDNKSRIQFKAWLIGVLAFGVLTLLSYYILSDMNAEDNSWIIDCLIGGILFAILKPWYDLKIEYLTKSSKTEHINYYYSKEDGLIKRIFFNLMVGLALLAFSALLGAYAWVAFQLRDFVENQFDSPIFAFIAVGVFVVSSLFIGVITLSALENRGKNKKESSNTDKTS